MCAPVSGMADCTFNKHTLGPSDKSPKVGFPKAMNDFTGHQAMHTDQGCLCLFGNPLQNIYLGSLVYTILSKKEFWYSPSH